MSSVITTVNFIEKKSMLPGWNNTDSETLPFLLSMAYAQTSALKKMKIKQHATHSSKRLLTDNLFCRAAAAIDGALTLRLALSWGITNALEILLFV